MSGQKGINMELTPEAQAVLDAVALELDRDNVSARIADAYDTYIESIAPPEPFTRYMRRFDDTGGFGGATYVHEFDPEPSETVWEVQITPIKRVR